MRNVIITGSSRKNSLGYKICEALKNQCDDFRIIAIVHPSDYEKEILDGAVDLVVTADLLDLNSMNRAAEKVNEIIHYGYIYALINCAGMNMNCWFEDLKTTDYEKIMDVNARAMVHLSQCFFDNLSNTINGGTILNVVSNAAHVPMRCSLAYNASKAAAKMITQQMARELTRKYNMTIFSVSPNKLLGTDMSLQIDNEVPEVRGWTKDQSDDYQNSSLLTGEQTPPENVAEFIAFLLSTKDRHFYLSGCDIPYGA